MAVSHGDLICNPLLLFLQWKLSTWHYRTPLAKQLHVRHSFTNYKPIWHLHSFSATTKARWTFQKTPPTINEPSISTFAIISFVIASKTTKSFSIILPPRKIQ